MNARGTSVVVAIALAGAAPVARADDAAARRKQAGQHVRRGDEFKRQGAYDQALAEYRKAYGLVPHPELFFNMAQVHRLAGDAERAIEFYQRYLAVEPDGRAAGAARRFVAELEAGRARPGPDPGPIPTPPSDPTPPLDRGRPPVVMPDPAPARGGGGGALRWTGVAVGGLGLVSLGVGIKFGLDARRISADLSDHDGAWTDPLLDRQDDGERAERRMLIFTGLGAGLIASGAVLFWVGHRAGRRAEQPSLAVAPWLGERGGGFAVAGEL